MAILSCLKLEGKEEERNEESMGGAGGHVGELWNYG